MKPLILVSKRFSIEQCRVNFDTLFVFGDNLERTGMGGQAIIREQSNSVGFATKKRPSRSGEEFFTDEEFEENCKIIEEEIVKINKYAEEKEYKAIAFPLAGLGVGLSNMQQKCPKTFCYMTTRLLESFGYNNIESLKPVI